MPRRKYNELVAGLFVVVCLVTTLLVVIWLGGAGVFTPIRQRACFVVNESAGAIGLEVGNPVRVNDATVGEITQILLLPDKGQTMYVAEITSADVRIHRDAAAQADVPFIGGGRLVLTARGSRDQPLCDAQNPIPLSVGGFLGNLAAMSQQLKAEMNPQDKEALLGVIHTILSALRSAAADIAKLAASVTREADAQRVDSILAGIRASVTDLNAVTASLRAETDAGKKTSMFAKVHQSIDDANKVTADAKVFSADVRAMAADAKPKLEKTMTAVTETAQQLRDYAKKDVAEILASLREMNTKILKISADFSDVSGNVREIVVGNRDNVDEMLDNLTQVSVDLKAASKEVRRNPWRLLYKPDKAELHSQNIYDAAAAFSSGASQLDQAISRLTSLRKVHPEGIPPDDPQLQKVRKDIEETFTRFSKAEEALWKELAK